MQSDSKGEELATPWAGTRHDLSPTVKTEFFEFHACAHSVCSCIFTVLQEPGLPKYQLTHVCIFYTACFPRQCMDSLHEIYIEDLPTGNRSKNTNSTIQLYAGFSLRQIPVRDTVLRVL